MTTSDTPAFSTFFAQEELTFYINMNGIDVYIDPADDSDIPVLVVWGNHDYDAYWLDVEELRTHRIDPPLSADRTRIREALRLDTDNKDFLSTLADMLTLSGHI